MTQGLQVLVFIVAVVVIANVLARRRRTARRAGAADFARQRGLSPAGDENPLLGAYTPLPPPPGIGLSGPRPQVLEAIASGRGTVRNALRGRGAAGEVLVLDYRMPPEGGQGGRHLFATWAAFRAPGVPTFQLIPRPRFAFGLKVVELEGAPGLSRRFAISAADEGELRRSFTPRVVAACEGLPAEKAWQLSAGGGWVLATFGLAEHADLGVLLDASERVAAALQSSTPVAMAGSP